MTIASLLEEFESAVRTHTMERQGPDRDYATAAKQEVERLRQAILNPDLSSTRVDQFGHCSACGPEGCMQPNNHRLDPAADVRAFHLKFGLLAGDKPRHLTKRKLIERVECLQEELNEFTEACGLSLIEPNAEREREAKLIENTVPQDLAAQADALVDLVYFALGTAVMMGLPWQELWDDVQRANMAKVRGVSHRGHAVDCVKPKGWMPPQGDKILAEHAYRKDIHSQEIYHADDPEQS